jgi:regulator of cell morphogenesis and NO signaling
MQDFSEVRLSDIVRTSPSSARILEKYHLDFCCKGKRTLREACAEKLLSPAEISLELETNMKSLDAESVMFNAMSPTELCQYIVARHHVFVKQYIPLILFHLQKVSTKHGERYPKMIQVLQLFSEVSSELLQHMQKEEQVLFPMIIENKGQAIADFSGPVRVMEMEHEKAGDIMDRIRQITNDYSAPMDACTTHRVCLEELKMFEEDLHKHVYLENHLLFPAIASQN